MKWDVVTTMDSRRPIWAIMPDDAGPLKAGFALNGAISWSWAIAVAFSLILAVLAAPALAQNTDGDVVEQATVLEEVVVEGEAPSAEQPQQDISAFGQILEIDELPGIPVSLSEALETAIGLYVRDFGGLGKLSTVTLRGLSSRNVLVMLDGVPLNSAALGGVDLSDIPLAAIERIELLRGPEAALFGNNSAGGIINIVRGVGKGRVARYAIRAGSFGYLSSDLFISDNDNNHDLFARLYGDTFRGEFTYLDNNGTALDSSDDFIATRENNEYDSWGFFTGLSHLSGDWGFRCDVDTYHARKGIPGLTTFPTPDADQSDSRMLIHFRGANENIAGGNGELDFDLNWLRTSRSYLDPSGGATGQPVDSNWTEMVFGSAVEYSEFIGGSHYFTLGADWGRDSFHPYDAESHRRDSVGLYIHDEITLGDSHIIPALRYDSIDDAGTSWSPKLGVRHEVNDNLHFKANWATGFRAPTFEELYRREGFVIGNPELLPEKTRMADFGFIYKNGPLRVEASYFRGKAEDLIEYVLGSGHRYRPLNFGKAKFSGYETSIRYNFNDAWRLEANVTRTDATDVTDKGGLTYGKQIPGRPKWDAYAGLVFNDETGRWGGNIAAYFAGGRYLTAANTKELDDDLSLNMGFNLSVGQNMKLAVEAKNLFDEPLMDGRGFPLPGRTFILSISQEV